MTYQGFFIFTMQLFSQHCNKISRFSIQVIIQYTCWQYFITCKYQSIVNIMTKILYMPLLTFFHLISMILRKHLERFPSFASTFASLSLEMRTRTHIQYTSFSCLHNFPNLKNCLVLLLQSFVSCSRSMCSSIR